MAPLGPALYVHLPFCASKCGYCDFNSWAWRGQDLRRHAAAVVEECRRRAPGLHPRTLFLGGGTPSLLDPATLTWFLEALHKACGFRDSACEVTMEANPESLDAETAAAARAGGVDRLSIGVQSLRNEVLSAYHRAHDRETALAAFGIARGAGFKRLNLDLIYAFPGQGLAAWEQDLEEVLALGPEHLSCYELSFAPGTPLSRLRERGRIRPESSELRAQLFLATRRRCAASGLLPYEVSNFARQGDTCRHNLAYWRSEPYLGIGAGACSWNGGLRRRNLEHPAEYLAAIEAGGDPLAETERPGPLTVLFDFFMMGLRLEKEGVDCRRAAELSGLDPFQVWDDLLSELLQEGLLLRNGPRLVASERGFMLLDSVLEKLLPANDALRV